MSDDNGNVTVRTITAVPDLQPPRMAVGYNYPWPFNRYGTTIGPRDLENNPPRGAHDPIAVWRDRTRHPPAGSLARNLAVLRGELNIRKVRMFLLGNAYNYGPSPISGTPSGRSFFAAPSAPHPLFFDHFRQMLEVFAESDAQLLPSLIDFGAFYPLLGAGGGRTSILTSQRQIFLETMLRPLLRISKDPVLSKTIFAWEVVNEPIWNTIQAPFFGRPHTPSTTADVDPAVMASFIKDCLAMIEGEGFASTVGHRFFKDLTGPMPTGSIPQFHYYGATDIPRKIWGVNDPDPIPTFAELADDSRTRGAFVGELGVAPGGGKNQFGDTEPGDPWPECRKADATHRKAAFERLKVLARKNYELAFIWPDKSDKDRGVLDDDDLKLSEDAKASIKDFTKGRFPNGVP